MAILCLSLAFDRAFKGIGLRIAPSLARRAIMY
ncbi:hypothetical protein EMIT0111MI5_30211 [Burkholderia sp. IT-111MI5]